MHDFKLLTNKMLKYCLILLFLIYSAKSFTQTETFSKADSLRGTLKEYRTCFDVTYYDLYIRINPRDSSIVGSNTISFKVIIPFRKIQIDLFENMIIDSIVYKGKKLKYEREYNAVFISFNNIIRSLMKTK